MNLIILKIIEEILSQDKLAVKGIPSKFFLRILGVSYLNGLD